MNAYRSVSEQAMARINRTSVLECLRIEKAVSAQAIETALGLDANEVKRIIDELIADSIVCELGVEGAVSLYGLNHKENLVISVDVGGTKMHGALLTIGNELLCEKRMEQHGTRGEESYALLLSILEHLLAEADKRGGRVFGASVGVPGVITKPDGSVSLCPSLGWANFPLGGRLNEDFPLAVTVENDLTLYALGELWFGKGFGKKSLAFIALGTGLGVGLVVDGAAYSGAHSLAGEMGYLMLNGEELGREYPNYGAMEQKASGTGLKNSVREALNGDYGVPLESADAKTLFEAHKRGESWTKPIIDDFVDRLAITANALTLTIDPEIIVFGGGVFDSAHYLIDRIRARLKGKLDVDVPIEVSSAGRYAPIAGGIVSVMHQKLGYSIVKNM